MEKISYELIDKLNDEDIEKICKCTNLDPFLNIFKKNPKKYKEYRKSLGNLDKKSPVVKKYLPQIIWDLYKKGEPEFIYYISSILEENKNRFLNRLTVCQEISLNIEILKTFKNSEFVDLYFDIRKSLNGEFPYDVFAIDLKLCSVCPSIENMILIREQIQNIVEKNEQEEMFNNKLKSELKKQEKSIKQNISFEKKMMENQLKKLGNDLRQSKNRESMLSDELDRIKQRNIDEKDKMVVEWKADIEFEICERKKDLLQELKELEKEGKLSVEEKLKEFTNELRHTLDEEFKIVKKDTENKIKNLAMEITKLESEKEELACSISTMKEEENNSKRTLKSLEKTEEEFFANIGFVN